MNKTKCPQMKCGFNIMGGCQNCETCDCEPNMINDNCDKCWNCAYDEGILRWDNSKPDLSQDEVTKNKPDEIKQEIKPIEVKTK